MELIEDLELIEDGVERKKRRISESHHMFTVSDMKEEEKLSSIVFDDIPRYKKIIDPEYILDGNKGQEEEDDVEGYDLDDGFHGGGDENDSLFFVDVEGRNVENKEEGNNKGKSDGLVQIENQVDCESAWRDFDEETSLFDIGSISRLRKLRKKEGENLITGLEYEERLRELHLNMLGRQSNKWSLKRENPDSNEKSVDLLMKGSADLIERQGGKLKSDVISIKRTGHWYHQEDRDAAIQSLRFSPNRRDYLMSAGFDRVLRLSKITIDDDRPEEVLSLALDDMPIKSAEFVGQYGDEVVVAGRRPFFYVCNLSKGSVEKVSSTVQGAEYKDRSMEDFCISRDGKWMGVLGRDGRVVILHGKTKQRICEVKMNSPARAATFGSGNYSNLLFTAGEGGLVYLWDLRSQWRCVNKFQDEGSLSPSAISLSPNGAYLSCGHSDGIVNLYSTPTLSSQNGSPTPMKVLPHLTTSINQIGFNFDSQIMAISSNRLKDRLRLVHLPSATVFSNWPTTRTPLKYVNSFDFSSDGECIAIGNDRGSILLYQLVHYHKDND